jgi:hypothetical protein
VITFNQAHDFMLLYPTDWTPLRMRRGFKAHGFDMYFPNAYWVERGRAWREIGGQDVSLYEHWCPFSWQRVDNQHEGPTVYIHTCVRHGACWIEFTMYLGGEQRVFFWPRSNEEITQDSIRRHVKKYIEKFMLFRAGSWRYWQRTFNMTREQIKEWYPKRYAESSVSDADVCRSIRRKYHGTIDDMTLARWGQRAVRAARLAYESGRRGFTVMQAPDVQAYMDAEGFDGDIDQLERLVNEVYDGVPKNAVLI